MRRWIILLLMLLLGLVIYLGSRHGKTDLSADYRYAVADVGQIGYVVMSYRDGRPEVRLRRDGSAWLFNDQHPVRPDAMANLLDAISRIELQFIPRPKALPHMMANLLSDGIRVQIYDRQEELLKEYTIGGSTPDERGTYIMLGETRKPAVAGITGWEGSLRVRYDIPPIDWRDRTVFSVGVDEVASITVKYPNQSENSFVLHYQDGDFEVRGLAAQALPLSPRAGSAEAYLTAYQRVGAESIVEDAPLVASLAERTPFVTISLQQKDGTAQSASFYPIQLDDRSPTIAKIQRYHVLTSDGTLYLVQHRVFEKLFLGLGYFK